MLESYVEQFLTGSTGDGVGVDDERGILEGHLAARGGHALELGPVIYFWPRHRMSRGRLKIRLHEGFKCVSMTWRAMGQAHIFRHVIGCHNTQQIRFKTSVNDVAVTGSGKYRSLRHRMPLYSRNEGSKCVSMTRCATCVIPTTKLTVTVASSGRSPAMGYGSAPDPVTRTKSFSVKSSASVADACETRGAVEQGARHTW
jgi:hypothetical protein